MNNSHQPERTDAPDVRGFKTVLVVPPLVHAGVALTSVAGPEHLGLAYLAGALRAARHSAEILNFDLQTYLTVARGEAPPDHDPPVAEMVDTILSRAPDLVGITVTGPTLDTSLSLATELKCRQSDLRIVFGGHQATETGWDLMREEPVIDYVGLGDCDYSIVDFVDRLAHGRDLEGIQGYLYRKGLEVAGGWPNSARPGDIIKLGTQPRPAPAVSSCATNYELDGLPDPARDDLRLIRREQGLAEARLSTSRGCTDHCTFCADADQHGFRRHTMRSPQDVFAEIAKLHVNEGIDHFWLVDDNFVSRSPRAQQRADEIAELLIRSRYPVTLRAYFRADSFEGRPDILPKLFQAGVITSLIGVESGSPRRLKYLGKTANKDHTRTTIAQMREVGMGLQLGFIFFDPLTAIEDMRMDIDFLFEIGEAFALFNCIQNIDVYPGTAYRRMLERAGLSTATHAYRGGFRQYVYKDPRIAPFAYAMADLYDPSLTSVDRMLYRLRAYGIPRLRWLARRGALSRRLEEQSMAFGERVERLCGILSVIHHRFVHRAIDSVELGFDLSRFQTEFGDMVREREPTVEEARRLADEVAAALATQSNRSVSARAHVIATSNSTLETS